MLFDDLPISNGDSPVRDANHRVFGSSWSQPLTRPQVTRRPSTAPWQPCLKRCETTGSMFSPSGQAPCPLLVDLVAKTLPTFLGFLARALSRGRQILICLEISWYHCLGVEPPNSSSSFGGWQEFDLGLNQCHKHLQLRMVLQVASNRIRNWLLLDKPKSVHFVPPNGWHSPASLRRLEFEAHQWHEA